MANSVDVTNRTGALWKALAIVIKLSQKQYTGRILKLESIIYRPVTILVHLFAFCLIMDKQQHIDNFFLSLEEPIQGTLLFLYDYILNKHPNLKPDWKYSLPFICFNKKMFCYFWFNNKNKTQSYIAFAEGYRMKHPSLQQEGRKRMKILRINPKEDVPLETINEVVQEALSFY